MKVIVTIGNSEHWQEFVLSQENYTETVDHLNNLEEIKKQVVVQQPLVDVADVLDATFELESKTLVIFYQQAEYFLSKQIQQGSDLNTAIESWTKGAESILTAHKQNRQCIKLINLEHSLLETQKAEEQLAALDVSLSLPKSDGLKSSFELLLSCQLVRQDKMLMDLNARLLASSLPVCDESTVEIDCNTLIEFNSESLSKTKAYSEEIEQLNLQIMVNENKLDAVEKDKIRTLQAVEELEKELGVQKESGELQGKLHQQELELTELQLLSAQEELDETLINFERQKQLALSAESDHAKKVSELNAELDENKHEQELFVMQLQQVQEELETLYIQNNELLESQKRLKNKLQKADLNFSALQTENDKIKRKLEQELAKQKGKCSQQLRRKELELSKVTAVYEKTLREKETLSHKLNQTNHELEQIRTSAFWKTAEPVRKLVKAVGNFDKKKAKLQGDIGLLLTSQYFDPQWYRDTYPDVAASGINPAEHYLKFGANEGRFPSPQFDGNWYLKRYPDVAEQNINPLIHYIKFGLSEGRKASPKMLTMQSENPNSSGG